MKRRAGFTFTELMVAILAASLLITAMTSVVLVSSKTMSLHQAQVVVDSNNAHLISTIKSDVQQAIQILAKEPSRLKFTVPDRDSDELPETIEYQFINSTITKTIWHSSNPTLPESAVIDDNAVDLVFDYSTISETNALLTTPTTTDEITIFTVDDEPDVATNLLLVVSNSAAPSSAESARMTKFQEWGYSVTMIDYDHADPAALLASNDVVYLSHATDPVTWNTPLTESIKGIVSEPYTMTEELGFGVASSPIQSQKIQIPNTPHYISQSLVAGTWDFAETAHSIYGLDADSGNRSESLQVVSTHQSLPLVSFLTPGAAPYASSPFQYNLGNDEALRDTFSPRAGFYKLVAIPITVTKRSEVSGFSAYAKSAGGRGQFGVYSDASLAPSALLCSSGLNTLVTTGDWINELPASTAILEPGDYWLAMMLDENIILGIETPAASTTQSASVALTDTIPATWLASGTESWEPAIRLSLTERPLVPNRRVQVPWQGTTFSELNDECLDVLKRAIAWAADPTPTDDWESFGVDSTNKAFTLLSPQNIPLNATKWKPTRIVVPIAKNASNNSPSIQFSLHYPDVSDEPGTLLQKTTSIDPSVWTSEEMIWYEIPFADAGWFDTNTNLVVQISGLSSNTHDVSVICEESQTTSRSSPAIDSNSKLSADVSAAAVSTTTCTKFRIYAYGVFQVTE